MLCANCSPLERSLGGWRSSLQTLALVQFASARLRVEKVRYRISTSHRALSNRGRGLCSCACVDLCGCQIWKERDRSKERGDSHEILLEGEGKVA